MKWYTIIVLLFAAVLAEEELELALECDEELCKLPDCRCSSTGIPGGLLPRDTPQFVTLVFDGAVNVQNIVTYRELLTNRRNTDSCPVGATFFINHEYTNYQLVNELYNSGYEVALHSISQRTPQTFWATASYDNLTEEIGHQRIQMAHFANIPMEAINGVRLPFFQLAGNNSYLVMKNHGLSYDNSWITTSLIDPGLWPYTLDYASTQECISAPCPTASISDVWVQPVLAWIDLSNLPCATASGCFHAPELDDAEAWYNFILRNFQRQYLNNRAPFGFHVQEGFVSAHPAVRQALVRFLDLINNLNDVFMVNSNEVLDWVKKPIPIDEYRQTTCRSFISTNCYPSTCQLSLESIEYWFSSCTVCPQSYPWVGNPLGQ